jgi:hypothetical protein
MTALLIAGALAGYALLMGTNPVRESLRDGLRAVRRYSRLWVILGLFGCGYALFELGLRIYFFAALPAGEGPSFVWTRAADHASAEGWTGLRDLLWALPAHAAGELARGALLPALDSLGGLFNNAVSTFPLAAVAALLLLLNWNGHRRMLRKALTKRFGAIGWLFHVLILATALVAFVKPGLYVLPRYIDGELWYRWSPVAAWLAFVFEYFFGVAVQVYLLLLAYCWLRGISFRPGQLLDFAIRRFAFVVRWSAVLLVLSTLLIDLPLILKNFGVFSWLEADATAIDRRNAIARVVLNVIFVAFAAVQITLTFRNESLRRSFRDHWRFAGKHFGALLWFIVIAGVHFFGVHYLNALCLAGFGEGTALWVAWGLLFPWLAGWVSFYRRAESGRLADKEWVKF